MKELDLSRSKLPSSIQSLVKFNINHNEIVRIPNRIFKGMKMLRRLYLSGNGLTELPASIRGLTKLGKLCIGCNQLEKLPVGLFGRMASLKELNLDSNNLFVGLGDAVFESLTNLRKLSL